MTTKNLREYHNEIENLINKGRYEEAITHCRHILSAYPKSIDTYRLLGKAFLEAKRYTDAIDIFFRVLSAIPDDFVSHLGLSIIREDEGNLDAAIWHMERAFENQPYNSAIQEELRRLFERRDGSAPPRMRLTRVALARMYVKGNLYQQASAEIRSILNKEPQRIDLQNLLAKMYLKSGKKVEAAEVSSKILHRLPYCFDANMVLASVLAESERKDEAGIYRQRLAALDPYLEFANQEQPMADLVVDSAVVVDLLDYQSTDIMPTQEQADWMTTLGLTATELQADLDEDLPDWLVAASAQIQTDEPTTDLMKELPGDLEDGSAAQFLSEGTEDIDMIEWLGSSDQNTLYTETIPKGMDEETIPQEEAYQELSEVVDEQIWPSADEEGIESAEIPDWLRSLAPESVADEDLDTDENLAGLFSQADVTEVVPEEREPDNSLIKPVGAAVSLAAAKFLFDREDEIADDGAQTIEIDQAAEEIDGSEPDQSGGLLAAAALYESTKSDSEELPDWLNEFQEVTDVEIGTTPTGAIAESIISEESTDLPDWLKEIDEPDVPVDAAPLVPLDETLIDGEIPDWFTEMNDGTEAALLDETGKAEDLPVWLREIEEGPASGEYPTDENQPIADQAIEEAPSIQEDLPDWLQGLAETEAGATLQNDAMATDQVESGIRTNAPENEQIQDQIELEEPPDFADADEAMAWLASLAGQTTQDFQEPAVVDQISEPESGLQGETTIADAKDLNQSGEIELESPPDFENADEAMAWLEELATQQPSKEFMPESEIGPVVEIQSVAGEYSDHEIEANAIETIPTTETKKLDLNRASLVEIERLPGVGYPIAQAILSYRETHGLFSDFNELANVPGINPDDIFTLQQYFFLESQPVKPASPASTENKPLLNQARQLVSEGEFDQALTIYMELIKSKSSLDDVIFDLNQTLQNQTENYEVWQILGDAYMRNDQMIEAMQAYNRAEELLG